MGSIKIVQGQGEGHSEPPVLVPISEGIPQDVLQSFVRKLDLSHLCFSLNFLFFICFSQFPSMFPLLTYSKLFFPLSANRPRHSRQRRSKNSILLIQETV